MLELDQHNKEESTEPSETAVQTSTPTTSSTAINSEVDTEPLTKKTCAFFRRTGRCRFGDKCRFSHIAKDRQRPEEQPKVISSEKSDEAKVAAEVKEENDDKSSENKNQSVKEKPKGNCYTFKKTGRCRYGDQCRFLHGKFHDKKSNEKKRPTKAERDPDSERSHEVDSRQNNQKEDDHAESSSKRVKQRRKLCRFYKQGSCTMADRCRFWHPQDPIDINDDVKEKSSPAAVQTPKREVNQRPQSSLGVDDATVEKLQKLRDVEINQLKVIFQEEGKLTIIEDEGKPLTYRVTTSPSDPEWPYDITEFTFDVNFPTDYPKEPFRIQLSDDEQVLPDVIIRHISEASQNWVLAKHQTHVVGGKIELIFRPFLRWLDRSLENLFTGGARKYKRCLDAKAAGFEFIPHKEKKDEEVTEKEERKEEQINEEDEVIDKEEADDDEEINDSDEADSDEDDSDETSEEEERNTAKYRQRTIEQGHDIDPQRKGTELRFKGLEMGDGYGTLTVKKLALTVQCERCKHRTDMNTPGGRANLIICPRCQQQFLLTFRPAIMHQFSAILGYLDLNGCLPFDVLVMDCEIESTCLSCNHQKQIKGLQYGQALNSWCPQCHNKQSLRVDSTRLQRLFASDPIATERLHTVKVQSVIRAKNDPAIQDGKPLPGNGICQHYKKSFRWLRFPCCGKCYPCDKCHDDDSDHMFTYANRMICGFCAKEQPFSPDSPCSSCHMSMTKSWSSHWEGGLGCRNKTKMNKGDKQKYSGKSKTLSKKAQEKKDGQSKKPKSK